MLNESEFSARYCNINKTQAPDHVGGRVLVNGIFTPEKGNTIIRHVTRNSRSAAVLTDIQEALKTSGYGAYFAFLPVPSFHMTVFEGVNDSGRAQNFWPEGIDYSLPLEEVTELYLERAKAFQNPGPFAMAIKAVTPNGLTMQGATDTDEALARTWRNALSDLLGYKKPSHDSYRFHVTMAYQIKWLPEEAASHYVALLQRLLETAQAELPVLELDPAALCSFEKITHFEELMTL